MGGCPVLSWAGGRSPGDRAVTLKQAVPARCHGAWCRCSAPGCCRDRFALTFSHPRRGTGQGCPCPMKGTQGCWRHRAACSRLDPAAPLQLPACGERAAALLPAHCPCQASRDTLVTRAGRTGALEPAGLRTAGLKAGSSGCVAQPRCKHSSLGTRAPTGSGTHQLQGADILLLSPHPLRHSQPRWGDPEAPNPGGYSLIDHHSGAVPQVRPPVPAAYLWPC